MKPHERRSARAYPYYKVATWDARSHTWRDGKTAHATQRDAIESITTPGRYRLSIVSERGRHDLEPFDVIGPR